MSEENVGDLLFGGDNDWEDIGAAFFNGDNTPEQATVVIDAIVHPEIKEVLGEL